LNLSEFGFTTIFFFITICIAAACKTQQPAKLAITWHESPIPPEFDYGNSENWAALPDRKDAADTVPNKSPLKDEILHFFKCVKKRKKPSTDAKYALDVSVIIEDAESKLI
jgi:hypothetical protein